MKHDIITPDEFCVHLTEYVQQRVAHLVGEPMVVVRPLLQHEVDILVSTLYAHRYCTLDVFSWLTVVPTNDGYIVTPNFPCPIDPNADLSTINQHFPL